MSLFRIELLRGRARARREYPKSKGFRSAYLRGVAAAARGRPVDSCPYPHDPSKTWRNSYRQVWLAGFESVARRR